MKPHRTCGWDFVYAGACAVFMLITTRLLPLKRPLNRYYSAVDLFYDTIDTCQIWLNFSVLLREIHELVSAVLRVVNFYFISSIQV